MELSLLGWIVVGFLAGALSAAVVPGRAARGCLSTILVGVLAGRARRWLTSVRAARVREGLMGAVLVGLGLKVALEHA